MATWKSLSKSKPKRGAAVWGRYVHEGKVTGKPQLVFYEGESYGFVSIHGPEVGFGPLINEWAECKPPEG